MLSLAITDDTGAILVVAIGYSSHVRQTLGGGWWQEGGCSPALFIANLAFSPSLIGEAKLGIFAASVLSAAAALLLLGTSSRTLRQSNTDP
jgi:Na+/H+ antiporter NhaA